MFKYWLGRLNDGEDEGELVLFAIFQPCLVIYGGQFPQLEEHIVPRSEPATFR